MEDGEDGLLSPLSRESGERTGKGRAGGMGEEREAGRARRCSVVRRLYRQRVVCAVAMGYSMAF